MKFYTVGDLSMESENLTIVGVILEGESGEIAGMELDGDPATTDSPIRVVSDLLREPATIVLPRGRDRVRQTFSTGQPGHVEAALSALRPPLCPGPRGTVTRVSSPEDMLRRVRERVAFEGPK